MFRGTQDASTEPSKLLGTGLSPAMVHLSSASPSLSVYYSLCQSPTTPLLRTLTPVWAAPLSLATTHGILSFPLGT